MPKIIPTIILIVMVGGGMTCGADRPMGGIKAGPMLSFAGGWDKRSSSSIDNASILLGLKAGVFFRLGLSDVISLQPEIQYALKRTSYYNVSSRSHKASHLSYLEISLPMNARVGRKTLELFAGPYTALLLSKAPDIDYLKSFDLGAFLGARFWLHDTSLEIQFMRGFIAIFPDVGRKHGYHNTTIAFQIGYKFKQRTANSLRL